MSTFRLVLVPGIITLAVTLLRLTGELSDWSRTFFSPEAGGGLAVVGIAWLVPIFGIYFATKLRAAGEELSAGRVLGMSAIAILAFVAVSFAVPTVMGFDPNQPSLAALGVLVVSSILALAIAYYGTGALGKVLFGYGLVARIPVILVMLLAILGNWGTHYDVLPPGVVMEVSPWTKWFFIGVVPQITLWMAFTVAVGGLFGGLALLVAHRQKTAVRTA
ncbi:MAG TPA: hypothetical protein VJ921_11330 [Vicinamibacteria bacterium]|nr:hypothetical protein [Vicinamibacteria bacterium]